MSAPDDEVTSAELDSLPDETTVDAGGGGEVGASPGELESLPAEPTAELQHGDDPSGTTLRAEPTEDVAATAGFGEQTDRIDLSDDPPAEALARLQEAADQDARTADDADRAGPPAPDERDASPPEGH